MPEVIAVLNAGSSSIKFSLFLVRGDDMELLVRGQTEALYTAPRFVAKDSDGNVTAARSWPEGTTLGHEGAIDHLFAYVGEELSEHTLQGVGHRVVHGGREYCRPVLVNTDVLAKLETLIPIMPLHQPHNLAPIRLLVDLHPQLPQVACFDTSFHRTNPRITQLYALPIEYADAGLIRYGFHGLSYEYIASVLRDFDRDAAEGKTVVLHLGNGASMCAMENGKSVTSTMGFSAVEGLPMGTRCGTVDPAILLYLMNKGMDGREIEDLIYNKSGLLGISGVSSDMRSLLGSGDPGALLAIDLFTYRIRREMGSLISALSGVDAIVFTGGIGENAVQIRERVCKDLAWLGLNLDADANASGGPCISGPGSRIRAWVVPTNEELMIARHTRRVIEANL